MSDEVKRLRRILSLFGTLLERERAALAQLHREKLEASRKRQDAVELLNSEDAFNLGISTLLISSSIAAGRREAAIKTKSDDATRRVLRRSGQIDSLNRRLKEAEFRLERLRQTRGD